MVLISVQKAEKVWEAVQGELQLLLPRPSYETWVKDTQGLELTDSELVVGTPSAFVSSMLEERMYSLISQTIEKVVQRPMEVRFDVVASDGSLKASPSDRPATAAAPQAAALAPSLLAYNRLNPKYTFDTFIVGKSNDLAHAASMAVADRPGAAYNPLFLYSGVGLGKTHLLHAVGHRLMARGLALIYCTTEEFTNEYIKSIREGRAEDFRNRYRSADVLLLDDIQFLIGKEQTQEGFFHTFNALHMAGKQVVITSDRPVSGLTLLEDRVSSRLAGGLVVDIQTPDLETRIEILRAKAEGTAHHFPADVLELLSRRVHKNIRELEGCLNRVAALAQLSRSVINLDFVKKAMSDALSPAPARRVSEEVVINAVSAYFSIDKQTIVGKRRDKAAALARHVAMYLLREEANLPLTTIGRLLGGKDHTTVLHACQRITAQIDADAHLRRDVINIREALAAA